MSETQNIRDIIEDGTNHIQVSAGRAEELVSTIDELKGSLHAGADALAVAIGLIAVAKTNLSKASEQAGAFVEEIRTGRDIFNEVGPIESLPENIQLMMQGLGNSIDNLSNIPDMFSTEGVEEVIRTLTRCHIGMSNERIDGALEAHKTNIRDYITRVAPHYIDVADEWRGSI